VLFKIHFWGWEIVYKRVGGDLPESGALYNFLAASDTNFKIQSSEFTKINNI
jgi:hypothetical protein